MEQLPSSPDDAAMLAALWSHFSDRPVDFEACAAELFRLNAPRVHSLDVTRPSMDGGRDAVGQYDIGPSADPFTWSLRWRPSATSPAMLSAFGNSLV